MGPGTSLLLTLLTTDEANQRPMTLQDFAEAGVDIAAPNAGDAVNNVNIIVDKIRPLPQGTPNLIKNIAQEELYETLYSIIKKEYDEPGSDPQSRKLNGAIGIALEMAMRIVPKTVNSEDDPDYGSIITLRNALRKKIFEVLTPK